MLPETAVIKQWCYVGVKLCFVQPVTLSSVGLGIVLDLVLTL